MTLLLLIGLDNRVVWAVTFLIFTLFALVEWRRYNFRFEHVRTDGISTHSSHNWGNIEVIQWTPLLVMVDKGLLVVSLTRVIDRYLFDLWWWWVRVIEPVCIAMFVVYFGTLHSPLQCRECWRKWLLLRYKDFALLCTTHRRHIEQVFICAVGTCIRCKLRSNGNRAFRSILLGNALLHA